MRLNKKQKMIQNRRALAKIGLKYELLPID